MVAIVRVITVFASITIAPTSRISVRRAVAVTSATTGREENGINWELGFDWRKKED